MAKKAAKTKPARRARATKAKKKTVAAADASVVARLLTRVAALESKTLAEGMNGSLARESVLASRVNELEKEYDVFQSASDEVQEFLRSEIRKLVSRCESLEDNIRRLMKPLVQREPPDGPHTRIGELSHRCDMLDRAVRTLAKDLAGSDESPKPTVTVVFNG